jgi:tetratricopeptide (TPR) repeat protein
MSTEQPTDQNRLIGRHRELQVLRNAIDSVAGGVPRVIFLSGEIGMGRTRLLEAGRTLAVAEHARCLITRTAIHEDRPLGTLLRADGLAGLEPFQSTLLGARGDDFFLELMAALAETAHAAPLWLMFDDLQAADEPTLRLLDHLLAAIYHGALRHHPIGVVLSVQTGPGAEVLLDRLGIRDQSGSTIRLTLRGFTMDEVAEWLQQRFGLIPDGALVHLLGNASGGNPLLLSELVRNLDRIGLLKRDAGRLTARAGSGGPSLPKDLMNLLASRIDDLSVGCRRAMTLAAFLGHEFRRETLAELLLEEGHTLNGALDEARSAALIEPGPPDTLTFSHPATRELLYESAEQAVREETHRRIAGRLIEELGDDAEQHCLTIVHHLMRGGAGVDEATLLRFAPAAAEAAFAHHSYFLAGRYFEAAADAAHRLPDGQRAALYFRAGEAFQRWSDGARSTANLERAVRLYERVQDRVGLARALQAMLRNRAAYGEADEAAAAAQAEAEHLTRLLDELPAAALEVRVRALDTLAAHHHRQRRYRQAQTCAEAAMALAEHAADPALRCIPVTSLALSQLEQLQLAAARDTWLTGLANDRAAGALRYQGYHLQRLPMALYCLGEVEQAARYDQASYRHNRAIGNTGETCLNLAIDVMIANLRGELETAVETGFEAMALTARTRYLWPIPPLIGALAYALTVLERFPEAEALVEHLTRDGPTFRDSRPYRRLGHRLQQLVRAHRRAAASPAATGVATADGAVDTDQPIRAVRLNTVSTLCTEVELALLERQPARLAPLHDALEFASRRGALLPLGWCCSTHRALAISFGLRGAWDRADAAFAEAAALADRAAAPLERARVALCRALTGLEISAPDLHRAERDLAEASEAFRRAGATALLRLTERAGSRLALHNKSH